LFKKKQFLTVISIAVMSFLIGTTFNIMSFAEDSDGNPFDEIWEAIYQLQAQVQSLNQTIESLKAQIPKKPMVITVYDPWKRGLPYEQWVDTISVSNVFIWEGANVFAITTVDFIHLGEVHIRYRVNDTYSETRYYQSAIPHRFAELHRVWVNLPAGNYTFAFQVIKTTDTELYISNQRLTLIIT